MSDKYMHFKSGRSLNEQLMVPPDITITAVPMASPSPSSSPSPQPPTFKILDNSPQPTFKILDNSPQPSTFKTLENSPQASAFKILDNQSPTQLADIFTTPVPKKLQSPNNDNDVCKYAQLLAVIEDMGKDIQPSYAGSKTSAERLKRSIVHARILVRECLMEADRSARQ